MSSILITQQTYSYKPGSDTTNLGSLSKQISEKENDVFRLITNMGLQKKKILICHEEWNLRLRIPRSDALLLFIIIIIKSFINKETPRSPKTELRV